jgi:CRISPR-associated protein Cas5d
MNKIQTESKGIRPINYTNDKNDLAYYTYLKNVNYQVLAHFEWNERRLELAADRNEHKHHNIAKRMIERGGRRDVFFGTRECQGYVEPIAFGDGNGYYDNYGEIDFGVTFHGFDYPDETDKDELLVRLDRIKMRDGYISFNDPRNIPSNMRRLIRSMKAKKFEENRNLLSVETEYATAFANDGVAR